MQPNNEPIIVLVQRYLQGATLTEAEKAMLKDWIRVADTDADILNSSVDDKALKQYLRLRFDEEGLEKALMRFNSERSEVHLIENPAMPSNRLPFMRRMRWAAAIVFIAAGIITAWILNTDRQSGKIGTGQPEVALNDILPGGNKAMLRLSDGSTIVLDSARNGAIAQQGSTSITKSESGEIRYDVKGMHTKVPVMNTMYTPKGGQYLLVLPDGSRVWLNAASSITYPVAFTGEIRKVSVSGEVYFEVSKDKTRPFIVDIDGGSSVRVLGTSFNINAYGDGSKVKATLVEGSVSFKQGIDSVVLQPGYQAIIASSGSQRNPSESIGVKPADVQQALAWKNGIFDFTDEDLKTVMSQLERWYDIKVEYKNVIPDMIFKGKMYRNANLSAVLKFLQKMGVKYELNGNKLIIF